MNSVSVSQWVRCEVFKLRTGLVWTIVLSSFPSVWWRGILRQVEEESKESKSKKDFTAKAKSKQGLLRPLHYLTSGPVEREDIAIYNEL